MSFWARIEPATPGRGRLVPYTILPFLLLSMSHTLRSLCLIVLSAVGLLSHALRSLCLLSANAHMTVVRRSCGCACLLYTSPSPRDLSTSRMPSSA